MTETRGPRACHYDRALKARVTRDHRDDCPREQGTGDCPADGRGCAPCTAPHCLLCGREHTTNDHPNTCPECIGKVRDDLTDIQASFTDLHLEALDAGADGRLVAAAAIPGGTAQVLIGPTVRMPLLRTYRGWTPEAFAQDHPTSKRTGKPADPIPPLAILAQWEDIYRAWRDHPPARRASISGAITYLADQISYVANHLDPNPAGIPAPDWVTFARQIRNIRSQLEHALHDEHEHERGVECFECDDRLVRRFRDPRRCRHHTPARAWLGVVLSYPELGRPHVAEVVAAKQPCGRCDQGGILDPTVGRSWECPGCRKEYDVGEYANAVRRDLVERNDGEGWCSLMVASEVAQDLTGRVVTPRIIRGWIARKDPIGVRCPWRPGTRFGLQEVFWPDVLKRASEQRRTGPRTRAS